MTTLERHKFQRLLFRTAFCVMTCDGEPHPTEINEIKAMSKLSSYFTGIDLADELEQLLSDLKVKGKHIVDELLDTLCKLEISTVQELMLLEVSFRIVAADKREDENEIKFVRMLRANLKVHDEIIRDRFGVVEYLFDKDYSQDIVKSETYDDLFSSLAIPEFKDLITVDFSNFTNK